jgi:hypothetical protein
MPIARSVLLSTVLPVVLLATGHSEEPSSDSPLQTVSGQVMTAHDDTLVIATESGEERPFVMDANVRVPAEASPGRWVTVTFRSPGGARAYAVGVRLDDDDVEMPTLEQLPRTSSGQAVIGVLGLTALAAGALIRAASRRVG